MVQFFKFEELCQRISNSATPAEFLKWNQEFKMSLRSFLDTLRTGITCFNGTSNSLVNSTATSQPAQENKPLPTTQISNVVINIPKNPTTTERPT